MTRLLVDEKEDFRGTTLADIDLIDFQSFYGADATFASNQFGPGKIANNVTIEGDDSYRLVGTDTVTVRLTNSGTFSAAGWQLSNWTEFDRVVLVGADGDDHLTGTSANDTLIGGAGADALNGGAGRDTASYAEATHGVTVVMLNPILNAGEAAGDSYSSIEDLAGSDFRDFMSGTNGGNTISGLDGDDTLKGFGGADTLNGGDGDDSLEGGDGNDTLKGGENNDMLFGGNDADTLNGDAGADTLDGGLNGDVLNGGDGNDTASYAHATRGFNGAGVTVVMLNTSLNSGEAAGDSYDSVENLTGSDFNDFLSGDNEANEISGGDGVDILYGQGDNDTLNGGNDNDVLFGGAGRDTLNGDANDDTLMGGTGNDVLDGGTGIDTAVFSDKTTAVVLTLHGATSAIVTVDGVAEDTVRNIENVTGGSGGDTLRGDSLANTLSGGIGNDTLRGGGGGDTLNGGNDADVFEYTATNDAIAGESVNGGSGTDTLRFLHTGTLDFQSVTVTSIERIAFANSGVFSSVDLAATQFGAGISNAVEITGNALQNAIDINMAAAGTFSAAGWTFVNWGVGNDILNFFGSDGADTITGSSQADQIRGGDGADTINAGDGGDIIIVQSDDIVAGETLNGGGGVGFDIVNLATSNAVTSLSPAMLIDIEGLGLNNRVNVTAIVTGSQIGVGAITTVSSTPGDRVQALIVNADNNADLSLVTFTGWDSPGKTITINGSSVSNILTGSSQIDALNGGGDADILNGGLGSDTLSGGTGKDAFFFTTTLNAATNVDTITDFSVAEVDTVLLDHTIFNTLAGSVGGTITSQEFRIGGAAQDADDRIIYNDATGALFFDPDGNGGTVAVQFATLSPGLALTNGLIGII